MSGVVFTANIKTKGKTKPKANSNFYKKLNDKKSNSNENSDNSQLSDLVTLRDVVNHRFSVLGVDIEFPFPPYGIQKAMMNKIILALSNKLHCLIESPTGTGKTLVLVCSVLAWQKKSSDLSHPFVSHKYHDKLREARLHSKSNLNKPCSCGRRSWSKEKLSDAHGDNDTGESCQKKPRLSDSPTLTDNVTETITVLDDKYDDQWDDVEILTVDNGNKTKNINADLNNPNLSTIDGSSSDKKLEMCPSCLAFEAEKTYVDLCGEDSQDGSSGCSTEKVAVDLEVRKAKIPRIYYGTRTHKQITQVIRELNKTEYRSRLNMTILSSRDRACVYDDVRHMASRNDKCRDLVANSKGDNQYDSDNKPKPTCPYYQDSQSRDTTFLKLQERFNDRAFDIEDAAHFGESVRSCPYFGLKALQPKVNITFCPYNYILDPVIRNLMSISLKNSIIILDEAHNIEDTCRESASCNISTKHIEDITDAIKIALNRNSVTGQGLYEALHFYKNLLLTIEMWMRRQQFDDQPDSNTSMDWYRSINFEGLNMENILNQLNLSPLNLSELETNLNVIRGNSEEDRDPNKIKEQPALNGNQLQILQKLVLAMGYMYSRGSKYLNSYKLVLARSLEREQPSKLKDINAAANQGPRYVYELHLFCMSPAIVFENIREEAWSIIVASGTLSPLESLKTELGTDFGCTFEGMHVIRKEQIFATIIEKGPKGVELNCSWKSSQLLNFQDEVGQIVVDVCKKVPNGVLCFFPSYDRMDKLYKRWFQKGYIGTIKRFGKSVYQESKDKSQDEFDRDLQEYNKSAEIQGAILFAVFRGKVSEGIDFADKAARAVITIGIPFPNTTNDNVNLKKKYNDDVKRSTPTIMTGGDWYNSQGFRALNQALGRCIRHQNDWGAILMIDSRLNYPSYKKSLSKWIRQLAQTCNSYQEVSDGLDRFIASRTSIVDENRVT